MNRKYSELNICYDHLYTTFTTHIGFHLENLSRGGNIQGYCSVHIGQGGGGANVPSLM